MKGYIYLTTYADKPGQIRVLTQEDEPVPEQSADHASIRYIAKFKNAHIAYMHVHNTLKKHLQDIDTRFYKVGLPEAIAAVECEDLAHERVWIDPALTESELQQLDQQTATLQTRHQRVDKIYLFVGGLGLLLLLFILLGGVWRV
jgi:hypothetical protein